MSPRADSEPRSIKLTCKDQWDDVDGIIVNGVKGKYRTTPWIFRTDFRLLGSLQGHILVLYTGTCKWTIYAPTDRTLDMEINRLRLEIECEVVDNELVEHAYLYPGHQVPTVNQVTKIRWRDRIHGTIDERSFRKQAFPIPFWNDTFIEDTFESEDEERNKQDRMLLLYAASPSRTWILIGRPVHESICLAMGVAEEMEEMGHVVESPVHFFGADFSVAGKGCLYRTVKKALRLLFRAVGGSMIRQSLKWRKYRDK